MRRRNIKFQKRQIPDKRKEYEENAGGVGCKKDSEKLDREELEESE